MLDLQATDGPAAFNSQKVWVDIIRATRDISTGLSDVATHISANNSGDAVDAMVSRLHSTSGRASTISENASVMNTTLGALDETRIRKLGEVTSAMLEINAIKALGPAGAAAARAAEKLFLGYYATTTQTELMGLIPTVVNLTSADRGTTGGTIDSAMNDIDGTGTRYSTDGVITPESLASQVFEAAQAYPESFERINAITRDMAAGAGADIGEGLFSPQGIRTEAATVTTPSTFTGLGATPGAAALGGGLGTGAGAGMPGFSGLAGTGVGAGAGTAGMAAGMAGMPLNATQVGTKGTSLTPNLLSAANTAALSGPLTGPLTSAGTGASMGRGLSGITPTSGSAGFRPGFSNGVTSSAPDADTARRTGLSAGGTGTGNGLGAAGRGGLAPMMGTGAAAGRGAGAGTNAGKRSGQVRTITSQVERDGDQKALLGERSPVVPGVIGDWVRDEPEGR